VVIGCTQVTGTQIEKRQTPEPTPEPSDVDPDSDTPRELLAHFIISARRLQKASERLDVALETEYAGYSLDTIDADEALYDVEDAVRCDSTQCSLEMDYFFTVETGLSEGQEAQVCTSITDFFAKTAGANGVWGCSTTLVAGETTEYVASVVYSETEENGFDTDEADFAYTLYTMQDVISDLDDDLETTFVDWELNTHGSSDALDYFDRDYSCDGGYCSLTFIISFSIANSADLIDNAENEESVCDAIETYFSNEAEEVTGEWDCSVSHRPTKDDDARFYAFVTYSEGSRGLTGGQKAGIIIGCLLIFLLLVIIVAVLVVQNSSKSRADYV